MSKFFLTIFLQVFLCSQMLANGGHEIKVKIDGYDQKDLYLGYHYGDKQYIRDTVQADADGYFIFKGEDALDAGVYLVIMAPDNLFFQLLINEGEQHFTVHTQSDDQVKNTKFKGSPDNELFYEYLKYLGGKVPEQQKLVEERNQEGTTDSRKKEIQVKLKKLDQEVKNYHLDLLKKYPKTFTALLVKPRMEIEIPEFEGDEKETQLKRYLYYKDHYFDNLDLADPRLLRSPILFERVNYYIEKLTPQHPDSLVISVDYLLEKMKPAEETYKYYLIHFLNKYAGSKVIGMDAVYVHIADNYYCKGLAPWTSEEQLEKICDNARRLKPVLIGKKARNITTIDRKGKRYNLYDIQSDYTLVYFWAPDCGHCKKMTPHLIEFYEKFKDRGITLMTICRPKSGEFKECWDYIDEQENMDKMLNTYDPSNRAQIYYNVRSTPQVFILDKDKKIIMKRVGADQLEEVMDEIIKKDQEKMKMENR